MNKKAEKLVLAFSIIGVLLVGSIAVLATVSSYNSEKSSPTRSVQTTYLAQDQMLSEAQAIAVAKQVAFGEVAEVELKKKRSDPNYIYYEAEFISGNTETEVKVHAYSGAVLEIKQGKADELTSEQISKIENRISEDQAKAIALHAVPNGRIISVEAEEEHGTAQYVIELDYSGRKTEVEVDMVSGAVLHIELEDEFEDAEDEKEDDDEEDDED